MDHPIPCRQKWSLNCPIHAQALPCRCQKIATMCLPEKEVTPNCHCLSNILAEGHCRPLRDVQSKTLTTSYKPRLGLAANHIRHHPNFPTRGQRYPLSPPTFSTFFGQPAPFPTTMPFWFNSPCQYLPFWVVDGSLHHHRRLQYCCCMGLAYRLLRLPALDCVWDLVPACLSLWHIAHRSSPGASSHCLVEQRLELTWFVNFFWPDPKPVQFDASFFQELFNSLSVLQFVQNLVPYVFWHFELIDESFSSFEDLKEFHST